MKISDFSIRRYGPLADSGPVRLSNFSLFWGENEDGKTLTLEALIRLLLGKQRKLFSGIDRVPENPDGYAIVENDAGQRFKLPENGYITTLLPLSAEECRNLFIIRNSDLSIAREGDFYGDITERLTGLRTRQVQKIQAQLRRIGQFTDNLETLNTRKNQHLKDRIKRAQSLLAEYDTVFEIVEAEGYDFLEERLVSLQNRIQQLERENVAMAEARLREKYEAGSTHLQALLSDLEALKSLAPFREEEYHRWQRAETVIREKQREKEEAAEQYRSRRDELTGEQERLAEFKDMLQVNLNRRAQIDEKLMPLIREWQRLNAHYAGVAARRNFWRTGLNLSLILLTLTVAGVAWKPTPFIITSASAMGLIGISLAVFYYVRFILQQARIQRAEQQVMLQAGELSIPGSDLSQLQEQLQRFEDLIQRQYQRVNNSEGHVQFLKNICLSLKNDRMKSIDERIAEEQSAIEQIQARHSVESREFYHDKLNQRQMFEQQVKYAATLLRNLFPVSDKSTDESLNIWKAEVQSLSAYQDLAVNMAYDEGRLTENRNELHSIQQRLDTIRRQLREFREKMVDMERRTREVLLPDGDQFPCRTVKDLHLLREQLQDFLTKVQQDQHIVRCALDIMSRIESDERQKVNILFGKRSQVSQLYAEVTEELYTEVVYDIDDASIRVRRRDGQLLPPAWLSSGAYDQLYFVIRLALGQKLLGGEKGFFILDDPFLKSDRERLERQLKILVDFSERGWQIIYFSAKEEVREVLRPYIDDKQVTLHQTAGVQFKQLK